MHEIQAESDANGWEMLAQVPEEPCAAVCADFVGPLPRLKHGNQMLLVSIDRFSKWTELVPLRSATAESLKKAFKERIIARYKVPKIVITYNEVQFASKIFKSFLAEMGAKQQFTAPYTPQENPTVRRAEPKKLGRKWPEIMLAVNTSVSDSTGYTPSFIT